MSVLSSISSEVLVVLHSFDEDDLKNYGFLSALFSLHCVHDSLTFFNLYTKTKMLDVSRHILLICWLIYWIWCVETPQMPPQTAKSSNAIFTGSFIIVFSLKLKGHNCQNHQTLTKYSLDLYFLIKTCMCNFNLITYMYISFNINSTETKRFSFF